MEMGRQAQDEEWAQPGSLLVEAFMLTSWSSPAWSPSSMACTPCSRGTSVSPPHAMSGSLLTWTCFIAWWHLGFAWPSSSTRWGEVCPGRVGKCGRSAPPQGRGH